jgi:hypothetical protein
MHRKNEQDSKPVFPSRTAQSTTHSHQLKQTHLFDLANRLRQRPDPAPDRTQIMHQKNKQNTKPVFAKTRRPINLPLPSTEKIQLQASRVWQRPGRPQPTQYPHPKQKPHNTCIQPVSLVLDSTTRLRQRPDPAPDRTQIIHRKNKQNPKPVFPSRTAQSISHSYQPQQNHFFGFGKPPAPAARCRPRQNSNNAPKKRTGFKTCFSQPPPPINLPLPSTATKPLL